MKEIPKKEKALLIFIFLLSLILRITIILLVGNYNHPSTWENGIIADNIVAGKGFSIGFLGPESTSSWQAPFYPYFLASFYFFLGKGTISFLLIQLIQAILSSLVPILIYKAAKILFDRQVSVISAIALAVFPLLGWYSTRIHHAIFIFFFIALAFYLSLKAYRSEKNVNYALAGIIYGIGALIEPVMTVIFFAFFLWSSLKKGLRLAVKKYSILLTVFILILLPWTIRNYSVHGKLIFIKSSFGKEFWMGNNPHATGTGFVVGGQYEITYYFPPPFYDQLMNVSEVERNRMFLEEGLKWIKENPVDFLIVTGKKIIYFWWYPPISIVRQFEDSESVKFNLLKKAYWAPFLFFLLIGFLVAKKNKNEYLILILLICSFYTMVYSLTHVGQQRFRGVIEPILLPFAVSGFLYIYALAKSSWRKMLGKV